jgi:hypothetical protein
VASKKAFLLRMSPELWEEVSRWAADELRSVNGQIEFLLRRAVVERRKGTAGAPDEEPPGSEGRGAEEA